MMWGYNDGGPTPFHLTMGPGRRRTTVFGPKVENLSHGLSPGRIADVGMPSVASIRPGDWAPRHSKENHHER